MSSCVQAVENMYSKLLRRHWFILAQYLLRPIDKKKFPHPMVGGLIEKMREDLAFCQV